MIAPVHKITPILGLIDTSLPLFIIKNCDPKKSKNLDPVLTHQF